MNEKKELTPPPIDAEAEETVEATGKAAEVSPTDSQEESLLYQSETRPENSAPSTPSFLSGLRHSFWDE